MATTSSDILGLLACPETRRPLRLDGDQLVADGPGEHRYPIEEGFPVLVWSSEDPVAKAVVEAFRSRSTTYFADNYGLGQNADRAARQQRVTQLLGQLVHPGAAVLEAGAGPAVLADALAANTGRYVALDLSLENLVAARRRIGEFAGVVGDLAALPVRDEAFDGTVAIGCLEYVQNMEAAVAELCRVTVPGGFILASFASSESPRRWWDEGVVHRASRMRQRARGRGRSVYERQLTSRARAGHLFLRGGALVERIEPLNPGLIGYPLSGSARVRQAEQRLARRFEPVRARASELLVLARKPGD